MTKFLCGECIHNSDKGGGCLIPKNLGYVDNCNRYLPKDKPIVQTNEEYIHSLNTEQLADVFFEYRYVNATPRQKLWMSASEECIKTDIVEWLKQPKE